MVKIEIKRSEKNRNDLINKWEGLIQTRENLTQKMKTNESKHGRSGSKKRKADSINGKE